MISHLPASGPHGTFPSMASGYVMNDAVATFEFRSASRYDIVMYNKHEVNYLLFKPRHLNRR